MRDWNDSARQDVYWNLKTVPSWDRVHHNAVLVWTCRRLQLCSVILIRRTRKPSIPISKTGFGEYRISFSLSFYKGHVIPQLGTLGTIETVFITMLFSLRLPDSLWLDVPRCCHNTLNSVFIQFEHSVRWQQAPSSAQRGAMLRGSSRGTLNGLFGAGVG